MISLRLSPLASIVALAPLLFVPAAAGPAPQGPPAAVRVDAVLQETLTHRRPVTGSVRAARRSAVAAREKGLVLELVADEGRTVAAGEVLARLDATQLELDLAILEAQRPPALAAVAERDAIRSQAATDLESLESLVAREAANPKELVDARAALAAAAARLDAARAELVVIDAQVAKLKQRIADTTIVAPFAGAVVATRTEVGAWVAEGDPVVEVLSVDHLEVWLEVPQDLFAPVSTQRGTIQVEVGSGGATFDLEDYRVIPDVDERGRAFRVVGRATGEVPIAAGMSVVALVPTSEQRAMLTVHRDAILRNQVGPYVYAVVPGAQDGAANAAPLEVEVLFQTEERAVVRSARLTAGTQVVVEGNERLYPMAPIRPIQGSGGRSSGGAGSGGGNR